MEIPQAPDQEQMFAFIRDFTENHIEFNKFLGMRVAHVSSGHVILHIPFRKELLGEPFRRLIHGGVISALADTAGGMAIFTKIAFGARANTVDMRVDYLRPGLEEDLYAEARVIRVGNRVGVSSIIVYQSNRDEPIAESKAVYNIRKPPAE